MVYFLAFHNGLLNKLDCFTYPFFCESLHGKECLPCALLAQTKSLGLKGETRCP